MLEISEIFHSLQGEGPFMGKPAIFIRLSGCIKPYCGWCDTKHAFQQSGTHLDVNAVIAKISDYQCQLVVITGGEPFLQWESGLKTLEQELLTKGYQLQYETSGKVEIPETAQGTIVCSPKFIENQWQFIPGNCSRVDAFKFVVDDDTYNIEAFINTFNIHNEKIWLMPLGAKKADQIKKMPGIWEYSVKKGYQFSPRLHVLAFDDKKGI